MLLLAFERCYDVAGGDPPRVHRTDTGRVVELPLNRQRRRHEVEKKSLLAWKSA